MSDELNRRRRRSASGQWSSGGTSESGPGRVGPWGAPPQTGDPHAPSGSDDQSGEPLDFAEIQFDDAFVDALSHDRPTPTRDDVDYQLAALLSGWRHEAVATPAPPGPSVDDVEHAIAAAQPKRRPSGVVRSLRIAAGAAAVAVVATAGLTVMSKGAQPGDPLWGVKKVAFAQEASETQAAYDVRSNLEKAEAAIAAGDTAQAASLIARAQGSMGPVDADTRTRMTEWINRLRAGTQKPAATSDTTAPTDAGTAPVEPTPPDTRTMLRTAPETTQPTNPDTTQPTQPTQPPTSSPTPTGGPSGGGSEQPTPTKQQPTTTTTPSR